MPTKTITVYSMVYSETPCRRYLMLEEGRNVWGLTSHTFEFDGGKFGYSIEGVRALVQVFSNDPNAKAPSIFLRQAAMDNEGHHNTTMVMVFKDLGIPQGATVTAASLTMPGLQNEGWYEGTHSEPPTFFRLITVKEPNYTPRWVDVNWGYPSTEKAEFWPQYFYPRRWRVTSYDWHQRHTTAIARWAIMARYDYTDWGVPNRANPRGSTYTLEDMIQEVVNLPKWTPSSKICFTLSLDNMIGGAGSPRGIGNAIYQIGNVGSGIPAPGIEGDHALTMCQTGMSYLQPTLSISY